MQSSSNWPDTLVFFGLVSALIIYIVSKKRREATATEVDKLAKENGLLERYKPMLLQLVSIAPDTRVLRSTLTTAELVGSVKGCKTYLIMDHSSFPKPIINVAIAVVTSTATRKGTLTYAEPANALDIWQDILVEVEKLIDNV